MPFAIDAAGRPIFLISNMAMPTWNLKADPRCSLFVTRTAADGDPPGAVGGFGVTGWVDARDYEQPTPDPLAGAASGILAYMTADYVDAMVLLAKSHERVEALR